MFAYSSIANRLSMYVLNKFKQMSIFNRFSFLLFFSISFCLIFGDEKSIVQSQKTQVNIFHITQHQPKKQNEIRCLRLFCLMSWPIMEKSQVFTKYSFRLQCEQTKLRCKIVNWRIITFKKYFSKVVHFDVKYFTKVSSLFLLLKFLYLDQ